MHFLEGFMHKICLKSKKKCSKNSKFSFSSKSLQIHSEHQKSVPNHCATLGKRLGSIFDHLNEFKTTFGKSNFRAPKALFPYWRLRRLQNQAFHGLQKFDFPKTILISFKCSKMVPNHFPSVAQ